MIRQKRARGRGGEKPREKKKEKEKKVRSCRRLGERGCEGRSCVLPASSLCFLLSSASLRLCGDVGYSMMQLIVY